MAVARAGAPDRIHEYAHDADAASYGLEAAEKLGVDPARVFRTLIAEVDGKPLVAVVPIAGELDRRSLGKRAALARPADAEKIACYVAGGISPLAQRLRLRTLLDQSALSFETIFVSAGRCGLKVELVPAALLELSGGEMRLLALRRGQIDVRRSDADPVACRRWTRRPSRSNSMSSPIRPERRRHGSSSHSKRSFPTRRSR